MNTNQQRSNRKRDYKNISWHPSSSPLDQDDSWFSNSRVLTNRIVSITDLEKIDLFVKQTIDVSLQKQEEEDKSKRKRFLNPYHSRQKKFSYMIFMESEHDFIISPTVDKILECLKDLRTSLFRKKKCDCCSTGTIFSFSHSGNFYCESCSDWMELNGQKQKPPYFGISLKRLNLPENLDDIKFLTKFQWVIIKEKLWDYSHLVSSLPAKEKEFSYGIMEKALDALKEDEDRREHFFNLNEVMFSGYR